MQNIHELIGLIKGIDFDGVINEQEVEELTSWVMSAVMGDYQNLLYRLRGNELCRLDG